MPGKNPDYNPVNHNADVMVCPKHLLMDFYYDYYGPLG